MYYDSNECFLGAVLIGALIIGFNNLPRGPIVPPPPEKPIQVAVFQKQYAPPYTTTQVVYSNKRWVTHTHSHPARYTVTFGEVVEHQTDVEAETFKSLKTETPALWYRGSGKLALCGEAN